MTSRSHGTVIRVYDEASNVTETYEPKGRFHRAVATIPVSHDGQGRGAGVGRGDIGGGTGVM
jgi:hypothetical protein